MSIRRCAMNPMQAEYSLCGEAFDAFDTGDTPERFEFAEEGRSITCRRCCEAIREIKGLRNPLRPRKSDPFAD